MNFCKLFIFGFNYRIGFLGIIPGSVIAKKYNKKNKFLLVKIKKVIITSIKNILEIGNIGWTKYHNSGAIREKYKLDKIMINDQAHS